MTIQQYKEAVRSGPFVWPGGYPKFAVTTDGGLLCFDCAKGEARLIMASTKHTLMNGWEIEAFDINWENPSMYCDNCAERIESAYAEDETGCPNQKRG